MKLMSTSFDAIFALCYIINGLFIVRHKLMSKITLFLFFVITGLLTFSITQAQTVDLDADDTQNTAASTDRKRTSKQTSTSNQKSKKVVKVNRKQSTQNIPIENLASDELYQKQINQIEAQVNELKEEIFRSSTRLTLLKESVLASGLKGTELYIIHRNEMGPNFKLEKILYILDGDYRRSLVDEDGSISKQEEIEIYNGPLTAGNHNLQVELIYRGNGYGLFSYMKELQFVLNDVYIFPIAEGKRLEIKAIAYEKEGFDVELQDRPDLRFELKEIDLDQDQDDQDFKK